MTEDLITDLSQISGLFVIARNSSFVFKGQSVDVKEVGHKLGVKYVLEGSVRRAGDTVVTSDVSLALPDKPSIAVLPFENMSGDPEQEYFADGIAEDITTGLSRFNWFFVIARNSTFHF